MRGEVTVSSPAESLSGARLSFRHLFLPIFWGCARLERAEQPTRDPGDVVDCRIERSLVRLGWFAEAADLPDELQRCSANLFLGDRRFNVEERPNVSTHLALPPARVFGQGTLSPSFVPFLLIGKRQAISAEGAAELLERLWPLKGSYPIYGFLGQWYLLLPLFFELLDLNDQAHTTLRRD